MAGSLDHRIRLRPHSRFNCGTGILVGTAMIVPDRRFDSFDNAAPVILSHEVNIRQLQDRVRYLEKLLDTLGTPWWKRALFRLDGWPPWYVVARHPAWRPWRRWWVS